MQHEALNLNTAKPNLLSLNCRVPQFGTYGPYTPSRYPVFAYTDLSAQMSSYHRNHHPSEQPYGHSPCDNDSDMSSGSQPTVPRDSYDFRRPPPENYNYGRPMLYSYNHYGGVEPNGIGAVPYGGQQPVWRYSEAEGLLSTNKSPQESRRQYCSYHKHSN